MKSILEEIYYDNEGIDEKIPRSEEYKNVYKEYDKLFSKLLETLNKEQQKMLDDLFVLTGGLENETGLIYFKAGFKFCMQLVFEGVCN